MASIKVQNLFQKELNAVLDYGLQEFGIISVKRFFKEYNEVRERLAKHPFSSSREPALKKKSCAPIVAQELGRIGKSSIATMSNMTE